MLLIRNRYYSDEGMDYAFDRLASEFAARGVKLVVCPSPIFSYSSSASHLFRTLTPNLVSTNPNSLTNVNLSPNHAGVNTSQAKRNASAVSLASSNDYSPASVNTSSNSFGAGGREVRVEPNGGSARRGQPPKEHRVDPQKGSSMIGEFVRDKSAESKIILKNIESPLNLISSMDDNKEALAHPIKQAGYNKAVKTTGQAGYGKGMEANPNCENQAGFSGGIEANPKMAEQGGSDFLRLVFGERASVIWDRDTKKTRILGLEKSVIFWDKDIRLARALEAAGIRLYPNCADCLAACDDKELTYLKLLGAGVPLIKTISAPLVFDVNCGLDADFLTLVESELGYPIVVKENVGSQGKQVYLASDRPALERLYAKLIHTPHVYQEFRGEAGVDIRVYVLGGRAILSSLRRNTTNFKSNTALGGDMELYPLDSELIRLTELVSSKLCLEYGSVDFLCDEAGYVFVEANSNAYFRGIERLGAPIAQMLADHIIDKISK